MKCDPDAVLLQGAVMPIGMPMISSKKMPKMAIITVAGNRCRMADATGSWVS